MTEEIKIKAKEEQKERNREMNIKIFKRYGWVFVILFGLIIVLAILVNSSRKMDKEWKDIYLTQLNRLHEEIKLNLVQIFNEFQVAVANRDSASLDRLCVTETSPFLPEWRNQINAIREIPSLVDDLTLERIERFRNALKEAQMDCFYAPGYALWSRLDNFCSFFKEYGIDDPSSLSAFKTTTEKFKRYLALTENRDKCVALIVEYSQ